LHTVTPCLQTATLQYGDQGGGQQQDDEHCQWRGGRNFDHTVPKFVER